MKEAKTPVTSPGSPWLIFVTEEDLIGLINFVLHSPVEVANQDFGPLQGNLEMSFFWDRSQIVNSYQTEQI